MPEAITHTWPPLLPALLAAIAAFGFGCLPFLLKRPERWAHWLVGFAAGAVLGLSIWHLLPHAAEGFAGHRLTVWEVALWAGIGIGLLWFIEHILLPHQHHVHQAHQADGHSLAHVADGHEIAHDHAHCEPSTPAEIARLERMEGLEPGDLCRVCDIGFYSVASFIGLSLHSFVDGLYIAFFTTFTEPLLPFLGILLHKFAEAFVLTTIFHLAGYPRRRTIAILIVFLAMTPLGAMLGAEALHASAGYMGYLSAMAAGGFLYIACHGLLPALWSTPQHRLPSAVAVLLGLGFIYLAQSVGHDHAHHGHDHGPSQPATAAHDHTHDHDHAGHEH